MIAESRYWKDDLLRFADFLDRRRSARRWTGRATAKVEKAIMVGCFVIRRLIESKGRLSDSTVRQVVSATLYPRRGSADRVTLLNWHELDRHFALQSPRRARVELPRFCNQCIHSYVFMPILNSRGGLHGVFVASDRGRTKALYAVSIAVITRIFRRAGSDYPDVVHSALDKDHGDFIVRAWTTRAAH